MNDNAKLLRRYLECGGFVLLWMAGGFYFHLGPIAYQLVGLPLIAGFQIFIARRPLVQLWARDAKFFQLDRRALIIAGILSALCAFALFSGRGRVAVGLDTRTKFSYLLLAALIPAAFALRQQRAAHFRHALPMIAIALLIRVAWRVAWAPTWDGAVTFPWSKLPDFLTDGICEFVALFLVDEVAFRGALDPHLEAAGTSQLHAGSSAIFVSLLWGWWHLPAYYPKAATFFQLFQTVGPQTFAPVIWGTALSFCARRSRTLAPTAAIHAAGNAYVLTLMK